MTHLVAASLIAGYGFSVPNTPVTYKCCSQGRDHRLPGSPAQKECQNSCVNKALAERPEAGSLMKHAIQQEMMQRESIA